MARAKDSNQLAEHERRYRELAGQLADIGLIYSGSITRRYTRCGTPGCKCHADPPELHGPYYQSTARTARPSHGASTPPRPSSREWIDNDRQLRRILQQIREVAAKTAELKLKQAAKPWSKV